MEPSYEYVYCRNIPISSVHVASEARQGPPYFSIRRHELFGGAVWLDENNYTCEGPDSKPEIK